MTGDPLPRADVDGTGYDWIGRKGADHEMGSTCADVDLPEFIELRWIANP